MQIKHNGRYIQFTLLSPIILGNPYYIYSEMIILDCKEELRMKPYNSDFLKELDIALQMAIYNEFDLDIEKSEPIWFKKYPTLTRFMYTII